MSSCNRLLRIRAVIGLKYYSKGDESRFHPVEGSSMNHWSANGFTMLQIGLLVGIAGFIGATAEAQGFRERARSLLGGDTEQAATESAPGTSLTEDEIGAGLKEALQVAAGRVVEQLGSAGGFNADPAVHIPLPETLGRVQSTLERIGLGSQLENLESRLNQAAEAAVPRARDLFVGAITTMTLEDVVGIYRGPDDAATQYFRQRMSEPLASEMRPVVEQSLQDVGAAQAFESVMDRYNAVPLTREVDADITGYVVEKGLDGIFYYLAQEEAAIRQDPVKRTSELLQRVFGN
jgi:hypothetical protein